MLAHFQEQIERIDRIMKVVQADDQNSMIGGLDFEDVLFYACQCMWHLKDWVLNDSAFQSNDRKSLKDEIHKHQCLLICSDIANGTKHFTLNSPKTLSKLSSNTGIHVESAKGIFKVFYYVKSNDKYDGVEIRDLLRECRHTWQNIIDSYYLSAVEV